VSDINAKITPNSSAGRFGRVGLSHHLSYYLHGILTLEDDYDEWAGGNETHQIVKESLPFMDGIVASSQIFVHVQHLHSYDFQSLPFQARNDLAGQCPLYGIRFDKH
jgi:hypothetical protein